MTGLIKVSNGEVKRFKLKIVQQLITSLLKLRGRQRNDISDIFIVEVLSEFLFETGDFTIDCTSLFVKFNAIELIVNSR